MKILRKATFLFLNSKKTIDLEKLKILIQIYIFLKKGLKDKIIIYCISI